jgi:Caulimovirus viroplasmin
MGKAKVYAVRKGVRPGVYSTWAECEAQVRGVSGASFKSFPTRQLAIDWLREGGVSVQDDTDSDNSLPEIKSHQDRRVADLSQWDPVEAISNLAAATIPAGGETPERVSASAISNRRIEKAKGFVVCLTKEGIIAQLDNSSGEHYERILLGSLGSLDVYFTSKKRYFRIRIQKTDSALKTRVERLWREYHWGVGERSESTDNKARFIETLLEKYRPFAHLNVDFHEVAGAVLDYCRRDIPPIAELRYDFLRIEKLFNEIRNQHHG